MNIMPGFANRPVHNFPAMLPAGSVSVEHATEILPNLVRLALADDREQIAVFWVPTSELRRRLSKAPRDQGLQVVMQLAAECQPKQSEFLRLEQDFLFLLEAITTSSAGQPYEMLNARSSPRGTQAVFSLLNQKLSVACLAQDELNKVTMTADQDAADSLVKWTYECCNLRMDDTYLLAQGTWPVADIRRGSIPLDLTKSLDLLVRPLHLVDDGI